MTGYFEFISISSAHIYHSALVLAPKESIVRQLYESHARPFVRVVRGALTSWDPNTASASRPSEIRWAAWSPCGRFIAIAWGYFPTIDVLDSVTLQRLQTFRSLPNVFIGRGVLILSPDSRILTYHGIPDGDDELCVSSWDLQTGGLVSVIRWRGPGSGYNRSRPHPSIAHSASGGIVGVFHWVDGSDTDTINIFICDVASATCMHRSSFTYAHPLYPTILAYKDIWTYGESFRLATADAATVTIREVRFTLGATCMEVETIRIPVDLVYKEGMRSSLLLTHTPGDMILLACANGWRIRVWDIRNSKCLLDCEGTSLMSFSPDGRFFVCEVGSSTTHIWKASPTGYVLHRKLQSGDVLHNPLLSPNGESMI